MQFLFSSFKVYLGFSVWLFWTGLVLISVFNNLAFLFSRKKDDK